MWEGIEWYLELEIRLTFFWVIKLVMDLLSTSSTIQKRSGERGSPLSNTPHTFEISIMRAIDGDRESSFSATYYHFIYEQL